MPDISKRLRKADERIAGIERNIGLLKSRVYFKPYGDADWVEATVISFKDNGTTAQKLQTGEEIVGHRFTVQIGLNWIEAYYGQDGEWAVTRPNSTAKILCQKEDETFQDEDTAATITLRVSQQVGGTYAAIG